MSEDVFLIKGSDFPIIRPGRTGILGLDLALRGGIPRGRMTILAGPESSLKTTVALQAAKRQLPILYIDADRSFNKDWFEHLGIDLDKTFVASPGSMEDAYNIIDREVQNPAWGSIILDSLGMLSPEKEMTSLSEEDSAMALRARRTNEIVRRISMRLSPTSTVMVILINHLYSQISGYINLPDEIPGGRTQRYLSSATIRLKRTERIPPDKNKQCEGVVIQWWLQKSKVSSDGQVGSFTFWIADGERNGIYFPSGSIDFSEQYEQYLEKAGLMRRGGAMYYINLPGKPEIICHGKDQLRGTVLELEDEIYEAIEFANYTDEQELSDMNKQYLDSLKSKEKPKNNPRVKKDKPSKDIGSLFQKIEGVVKDDREDRDDNGSNGGDSESSANGEVGGEIEGQDSSGNGDPQEKAGDNQDEHGEEDGSGTERIVAGDQS